MQCGSIQKRRQWCESSSKGEAEKKPKALKLTKVACAILLFFSYFCFFSCYVSILLAPFIFAEDSTSMEARTMAAEEDDETSASYDVDPKQEVFEEDKERILCFAAMASSA
jgi:hypothetical protein